MKPRIKQPEQPASRPFWAVHVRSKSGIAHLVTAESTIFLGRETSDTPFFYVSECGRRYAFGKFGRLARAVLVRLGVSGVCLQLKRNDLNE